MTVRYAFFFDSKACSGCKACQVACKDKHDLEVGRLWRRVYEVCGGGWESKGSAWKTDVFAYNLSIACNHCRKPICVEVCPTTAMHKRPDGIVLVDQKKCIGCRYCAWACPYGSPQRDESIGKMSKCHFCHDELDQGRPPACVAACPLRVLDFGDLETLENRHGKGATVFPLPGPELTLPSLVLHPHPTALSASKDNARVANREEVRHDA